MPKMEAFPRVTILVSYVIEKKSGVSLGTHRHTAGSAERAEVEWSDNEQSDQDPAASVSEMCEIERRAERMSPILVALQLRRPSK